MNVFPKCQPGAAHIQFKKGYHGFDETAKADYNEIDFMTIKINQYGSKTYQKKSNFSRSISQIKKS